MKVYKYPSPLATMSGEFTLVLPRGAQIVHFDYQYGKIVLWALVDDALPREPRRFSIVLTGEEIKAIPIHIKTLLLDNGSFVIHLFELKEDRT